MPTWRSARRAPIAAPICPISRRRSTPARRFDPLGDLGPLDNLSPDRSRSTSRSLSADATATGPLFALPAGEANATFKLGAASVDLDSKSRLRGIETRSDLGRDSGRGFGQPRPADRQARVVDRAARRQPQCRHPPAQRFRDAHHARGGTQLGAQRAAQFHRQLDPRGRRSNPPPARRSVDRDRECSLFRCGPRRDGQRHHADRRQSQPRCRPPHRGQDRRQLAPVRKDRPEAARRVRPPDDRPPADQLSRRDAGARGGFPDRFVRDADRPADQRRSSSGERRALDARHHSLGLRLHQAAALATPVGRRRSPRSASAPRSGRRAPVRRPVRRGQPPAEGGAPADAGAASGSGGRAAASAAGASAAAAPAAG